MSIYCVILEPLWYVIVLLFSGAFKFARNNVGKIIKMDAGQKEISTKPSENQKEKIDVIEPIVDENNETGENTKDQVVNEEVTLLDLSKRETFKHKKINTQPQSPPMLPPNKAKEKDPTQLSVKELMEKVALMREELKCHYSSDDEEEEYEEST